MFAKVHRPNNIPGVIDNKGSCQLLADYLDKENQDDTLEGHKFFSNDYDEVSKSTVINRIDTNISKLGKKDDKFYMLSLNLSHSESKWLISSVTGKDVDDFSTLSQLEKQAVFKELREYTRQAMDQYALNFNRENLKSGGDLVYYAMVETQRKYHYYEKAVKEGRAKTGDTKSGLNLHVHVIVSRKDKTQTMKLSPLSKSKGDNFVLNGKNVQRGFNHEQWKLKCSDLFCEMYNYYPAFNDIYIPKMISKIEHKIKNNVTNELLSGNFAEEKKAFNNAKKLLNIIHKPEKSLTKIATKKIKDILLGRDLH